MMKAPSNLATGLRPALLTLMMLALQLLLLHCSPAESAGRDPSRPPLKQQRCGAPECSSLLRRLALAGSGGGPSVAQFPFRVVGSGTAARCHPPADGRVRARFRATVRPLLASSGGGGNSWSFTLATDANSGASVLTPEDPAGPTVHWSRRHGPFAVSRTRLLGLVQCERLEGDGWWGLHEARRLLTSPTDASQVVAVLHFGYSRALQLWLGETEAHEVRILHEASGVCAVQRSWRLTRNATGDRQPLVVEYAARDFQFGSAGGDGGDLRLPTACYREEL